LSDDRPDPDALLAQTVDEGPGRPPGSEERIFEKFERGRKERATPGVGLGLAICRAIVGARGGSIRGRPASRRWSTSATRMRRHEQP